MSFCRLRNKDYYETMKYVIEKDTSLIKSEKNGLVKYLKKEVVQNQEFLEHIDQLKSENERLKQ